MLRHWKRHNPKCVVCAVKGPGKKARSPLPTKDPHHVQGRAGDLRMDLDHCIPVCRECHNYIHDNPRWAYDHELLKVR